MPISPLLAALAASVASPSGVAGQSTPAAEPMHHDHMMPMPAPVPSPTPADQPGPAPADPHAMHHAMPEAMAMPDHQGHDMMDMPGMAMMPMGGSGFATGSGTSRVPENDGAMHGLHLKAGHWGLMLHGFVTGAFTDQGGPRGRAQAFSTSMGMLTAGRELAPGVRLRLQAMLSLDALMGPRGYPNLFATGETADGINPLIDRQHPHDLFMELSARVDVDVGPGSAFLYAAPAGEPALGPSVFMMRASGKYLPLSPITHHWFDSSHISYGVVTAGYATRHWQIESSAFHGREPDQHRWDFEAPALDSWSVRATWLPASAWAVQVSHGFLKSPEQLEPDDNERRTTASVQYSRAGLAALLGFSAKDKGPGRTLTAWIVEANWTLGKHHTLFGRAENVANDELFPDAADPLHGGRFRITKVEGGYAWRQRIAGPVELAMGGSVAGYAYPAALDGAYGRQPISYTLFVRLGLGG